jgi:hypothetical protein
MAIIKYNRRNFLSSIAILSAGTAFSPAIKYFSIAATGNDLQKKWTAFWKLSGGRIYNLANLNNSNNGKETKGHHHKCGEIIYFPQENILAQPTWIFWKNDLTKPADVIITLFENNFSFKRILCFNRYEMDALYLISKEPDSKQLLLADFNNKKPVTSASTGIIKIKTDIKKNSQIQDISYYKGQLLIFEDKIIHHT